MDSGIYARHIEFRNRNVLFKDFVNNRREAYDDNGHGTHVAGILAGNTLSYAKDTDIIALKILDKNGNGNVNTLCSACRWINDNYKKYNIRVVNVSIGGAFAEKRAKEKQLLRCIEMLSDCGIIVCCAAGNNGPSEGSITPPGTSDKVITVGAVCDELGKDMTYCKFSGRGSIKGVVKPEFVAIGNNVLSSAAHGGYERRSGTSMATPKVASVAALICEAYPEAGYKEVKEMLKNMAVGLELPVNIQGYGLIDAPICVEMLEKI